MSTGSPVGISDEMQCKGVRKGKQEAIQNTAVSSRLGKSMCVQRRRSESAMTPNTPSVGH